MPRPYRPMAERPIRFDVLSYAMNKTSLLAFVTAAVLGAAVSAEAQLRRTDPATGEKYAVEVAYGWWSPAPDIEVSSESLGIPGTVIDFVEDFGYEKKRLPEFRAVLRPARKHKFRLDYVPIQYEVEGAVLRRPITFNGQTFNVGLPVNADTTWNTWRFGYEYDFIYRDRGFVGLLLEAKYTKASINFEPGDQRVRRSEGADSGGWADWPRLSRPQPGADRRVLPLPPAQSRGGRLQGPLLRPRPLRDAELHQQRRRHGRLALARRELYGRLRLRPAPDEGLLLHGRRAVLIFLRRAPSARGAAALQIFGAMQPALRRAGWRLRGLHQRRAFLPGG
jgi:hypothetical protein